MMVILAISAVLMFILIIAALFMLLVEEIPDFLKVWHSLFDSKNRK